MIPATSHAVIEISGVRYDSRVDKALFAAVSVELTTGQASETEWRIFDPDYRFLDRYTVSDGIAQLEAQVWLGLGDNLGQAVFTGLLASAERDEGAGATVFRFYDHGYVMRKVERTEYHKNLTDVEIIAKLAKRNNLKFDVSSITNLKKNVSYIQKGESDWHVATDCAERAGLVLYVRGKTLYAREAAKFNDPVVSLINKQDFRLLRGSRFRYRLPETQEGKPSEIEVRGRGVGGRRLTGKAPKDERGRKRIEIRRDIGKQSRKTADARAKARKELQREHAFTGQLQLLPSYTKRRPDARDTIEIVEVGKLFSGLYLCDTVAHSFAPGHLITEIEVYRDIRVK